MLITTTDNVEGHPIERYLGIVTGEAVFGVGVSANLKAGFTDLVGGRVESYEKELETAKNHAMVEMIKEAQILAAHAVVGIDIDYMEIMGKFFMVVMSGTAVTLKNFEPARFPDNFVLPTEKRQPED